MDIQPINKLALLELVKQEDFKIGSIFIPSGIYHRSRYHYGIGKVISFATDWNHRRVPIAKGDVVFYTLLAGEEVKFEELGSTFVFMHQDVILAIIQDPDGIRR